MPHRKRLFVAAAALASSYMASVAASESAIQAHCLAKWSGDAMRAYCLEEQRSAAEAVAGYSGAVRNRCESEWSADFHMVLFCIREQLGQTPPAVADMSQER